MKTLEEMREIVKNKQAEVLTIDAVKQLEGKQIQIFSYGYRGQDVTIEFRVGHAGKELNGERTCLYDADGNEKYLFLSSCPDIDFVFTCGDDDRIVYYIIAE